MIAYAIGDWFLVSRAMDIEITRVATPDDARALSGTIYFAVVWIIYVHRSVRVRNTFVK